MACFPLVPYANRIANGRFAFAGDEVQLRRNWDRDPHPLHGQGWRSAWTIEHERRGAGHDWHSRWRR